MRNDGTIDRGYVFVGLGGMIVGGLAVALVTRAIPRMASKTAAAMMERMTCCAGEGDFDPGGL
jgi:hypothetical protein